MELKFWSGFLMPHPRVFPLHLLAHPGHLSSHLSASCLGLAAASISGLCVGNEADQPLRLCRGLHSQNRKCQDLNQLHTLLIAQACRLIP